MGNEEPEGTKVSCAFPVSNFSKFDPDSEPIENFLERLESYFRLNVVSEATVKVDHLVLLLGTEQYNVLKNKLAPRKISSCSFDECSQCLISHYAPKTRVISETFKFHSRMQKEGESITDFITDLKQLSIKCEFETYLDRALRDQLVVGLNDKNMINRLLLEDSSLKFEKACQIVLDMESASHSASSIMSSSQRHIVNAIKSKSMSNRDLVQSRSESVEGRHQVYQGRGNSPVSRHSQFRDGVSKNRSPSSIVSPRSYKKKV